MLSPARLYQISLNLMLQVGWIGFQDHSVSDTGGSELDVKVLIAIVIRSLFTLLLVGVVGKSDALSSDLMAYK
eukprot:9770221-Ditylum_brightwellii.AAC.1